MKTAEVGPVGPAWDRQWDRDKSYEIDKLKSNGPTVTNIASRDGGEERVSAGDTHERPSFYGYPRECGTAGLFEDKPSGENGLAWSRSGPTGPAQSTAYDHAEARRLYFAMLDLVPLEATDSPEWAAFVDRLFYAEEQRSMDAFREAIAAVERWCEGLAGQDGTNTKFGNIGPHGTTRG